MEILQDTKAREETQTNTLLEAQSQVPEDRYGKKSKAEIHKNVPTCISTSVFPRLCSAKHQGLLEVKIVASTMMLGFQHVESMNGFQIPSTGVHIAKSNAEVRVLMMKVETMLNQRKRLRHTVMATILNTSRATEILPIAMPMNANGCAMANNFATVMRSYSPLVKIK